ncbi:MAG: DNA mismatch repair endonuclease MutL [Myxococcales bacterium]|nr:DNA mismatch repair endonuclease MutL [Myxococcales bacterium]
MNRVVRLSDDVVNQIAAGEAVERPASVVKELVENAIDAEARHVRVEVEQGGLVRILVLDDGVGMSREDAVAALERHATSKIRSTEDLVRVATLGFRGEALPSIASVSRFVLVTKTRDRLEGTRIRAEGTSTPLCVEPAGAPEGTSVEVCDLFFNVPARRKFLRRPSAEMAHVTETLARLAMSRRDLSLTLLSNGRTVLDVPRERNDARARLGRLLGRALAERLIEIGPDPSGAEGSVRVSGWAAEPGHHERTARSIYVFVNGRYVRDRNVLHALHEAYSPWLERGRYPAAILFLEVPKEDVDVNVHPQKTEVRFRQPRDVHRAVTSALREALGQEANAAGPVHAPSPRQWTAAIASSRPSPEAVRRSIALYEPDPKPPMFLAREDVDRGSGREQLPAVGMELDLETGSARTVGLVFDRYLVEEMSGHLVIYDLEAIAVRKRELEHLEGGPPAQQALLVPKVVEVAPSLFDQAAARARELQTMGLEVDTLGENTLAIRAGPADLTVDAMAELLIATLSAEEAEDESQPLRRLARAERVRVPRDPRVWTELSEAVRRDSRLSHTSDGAPTRIQLSRGAWRGLFTP